MHRALKLLFVVALASGAAAQRPTQLRIHFVDVEGGQATLFTLPSGESLLVDSGWAGFDGRDADRIAAAAKRDGVSRIDTLLVTHYHADHVGGVPAIAQRLPVRRFVDHGPTVESGTQPAALFTSYTTVRDKAEHVVARPGDMLKVGDLELRLVSAGGELITKPLPGAGQPNTLCADYKPKDADPTENARSVGMVLTYGRFRILDLGDLTWNKEHDLVCPNNLLGTVDVYLTTHHGMNISGVPALVHAVRPRVAIMNNGSRKGGTPDAWSTVKSSPGLEDLWQIHTAVAADAHNVAETFIANVDESSGNELTIAADRDGSFSVTNPRNGQTKQYRK
ncbi:MAG TPA: MBL fold metallo-hydrolase [Vicinamibacterales bacterium]|nr:MBL fold metallo-hydrolase [Vicinamibacterales bacterium]